MIELTLKDIKKKGREIIDLLGKTSLNEKIYTGESSFKEIQTDNGWEISCGNLKYFLPFNVMEAFQKKIYKELLKEIGE